MGTTSVMVELYHLAIRYRLLILGLTTRGLVVAIGILTASFSSAETYPPKIAIDTLHSPYFLSNFLLYEDPSSLLTVDDILRESHFENFIQTTAKQIDQGYTDSTYWLKFTLQNNLQTTDYWYLKAVYPMVQIQVYKVKDNEANYVAIAELPGNMSASKIFVPSGSESTFLMRVNSKYLLDLHFRIYNESSFYQHEQQHAIIIALVAGGFLAMILYNFFLYLSLRDSNYLYYLVFVVINCHLGLLAVKFPAGIFSWFGLDWWAFIEYYRVLGPFTTFLFARSFLQTKSSHPIIDKIFTSYMAGLMAIIIARLFLPRTAIFILQDYYFLVGIIILIAAGIFSLKKGFKPAKFYLIGIGCFMVGIYIYIAASLGLISRNPFTLNAHIVSLATEMLLMSLALAAKIKLLQQDKIHAELATQVKGQLLQVISHDIANPLTIVKGVAYLLRNHKSNKIYIDQLLRSVAMIEEIMQFVLKKESLDSGRELALETIPLKQVFEDLLFLFQSKAVEKGVKLSFELEDHDLTVQAEKTSLTNEVLGNLISNAIKFSHPGSEVSVRTTLGENGNVIICVQDQGVGINRKTIDKLFDPIQNRSRQGTNSEKGVGYGLPLAKAFVNAFGGDIQVESRSIDEYDDGCGSIFRAIIPSNYSRKISGSDVSTDIMECPQSQ